MALGSQHPRGLLFEESKERVSIGTVYIDLLEERKSHAVVEVAEGCDVFRGAGFLRAELVAREAEDSQALRLELLVELLQASYCGVNPQRLAVLTMSRTRPA